MARYVARVPSPRSADATFDFVADLRNLPQWDPGAKRAVLAAGAGPGLSAAYDVTVGGVGRDITLRYETIEHEPGRRTVVRARTRWFLSLDTIVVEPAEMGAIVAYEARLEMCGPLRAADPLLRLVLRRIGNRAAAGLRRRLEAGDW
ncbi:MAG: hypothetical protein FJZ92_08515 [Chloroflexi bacterium]|nr:hypothetical protein [Chloroflexota bacterium]MBM4247798.1 hypothetical protein [Deltaproteobacteria bacterium]